jgi:Protein of unknown function (DUF664)
MNSDSSDTSDVLREPPMAGSELDTLLGGLERQRRYIAWKCGDLDAAGLRARLAPSAITLGGLLKHLALVEDDVFAGKLHGRPYSPPFDTVDFESDPEWEWRTAADDSPEQLMALWEAAVARSRDLVAESLAAGGLDGLGAYTFRDGSRASLRRLIMDMLEEYARHVGHADLIRESVDGVTGEDPTD